VRAKAKAKIKAKTKAKEPIKPVSYISQLMVKVLILTTF
jgi:hypothetical protein